MPVIRPQVCFSSSFSLDLIIFKTDLLLSWLVPISPILSNLMELSWSYLIYLETIWRLSKDRLEWESHILNLIFDPRLYLNCSLSLTPFTDLPGTACSLEAISFPYLSRPCTSGHSLLTFTYIFQLATSYLNASLSDYYRVY